LCEKNTNQQNKGMGDDSSDTDEEESVFMQVQKRLQDVKDLLRELTFFAPFLLPGDGYSLAREELLLKDWLKVELEYAPFNFEMKNDYEASYRFSATHVSALARVLLGESVESRGCKAPALTAMCLLLRRLSYPCRWVDLRAEFGGASVAWMSTIFVETLNILYVYAHKELHSWSPNLIEEIEGLVGFAQEKLGVNAYAAEDGTGMHICRAHLGQRAFYSGYEGYHLIRTLAICKFNGMFERVFGPTVGSASDIAMHSDFDVEAELDALHSQAAAQLGFRPLILGDSIFSNTANVLTPFKRPKKSKKSQGVRPPRPKLDQMQTHYNLYHAKARIGGEWGFQRVVANFATLDFSKAHKVFCTSPDKCFLVGMLFTNFIVAARGSQHEHYYGTRAPTFEVYLTHIKGLV
jgi:hypothetical protein